MSDSTPQDPRISAWQKKAHAMKRDLQKLELYIDHAPEEYREDVRALIRTAIETGMTFKEIDRLIVDPPVGEDGSLLLGAGLREHVTHIRELLTEKALLHQQLHHLLGKKENGSSNFSLSP